MVFFFFQAEDGIRDVAVTGVQTCALPIYYDYTYIVQRNSDFLPNNGSNIKYLIQDKVDFSFSSSADPTEQTVYSLNGTQPEYFLLKKTVKAISAELKTATFTVNNAERFKTLSLDDSNIIGI